MKTSIFFEIDKEEYEASFDAKKLEKFRKELNDEASVVEHHSSVSVTGPQYNSNGERDNCVIHNYWGFSEPWIDVWDRTTCTYDKYVIPYLSRLILKVEKGDSEALKEILYPTLSNEYIPVQEAIKNYSERIKDYKIYDEKFPTSPLKDKEEYKSLLLIIKDYINILTDDNYTEKFKPYYNEAKSLFDVKRIKREKEKVLMIRTR